MPETATFRFSISWDDYRYVAAVAAARSLNGAAEMLGVNHSTVFRRINAIEAALGARLFERGRTGYALTVAGEEMVALADRMGEEIVAFERRVAGRDVKPSGELRVTVPDSMMNHLMAPVFAAFLDACPDIRLDIVVSNQSLNLSKRDADIAIRATSGPPDTLVGRRVAGVAWAVYGPPRLLGRDAVDLAGERWVGFGDGFAAIGAVRWLQDLVAPERVVMRVNTLIGIGEAVESGVGLGIMPCFIGDRISSLVRLLPPIEDAAVGLWLLTHPDLRQSARVRAFMDFAWSALGRHRALLEGRGATAEASAIA